MGDQADKKAEPRSERDVPLKIELEPEAALRALLEVDPDAKPIAQDSAPLQSDSPSGA